VTLAAADIQKIAEDIWHAEQSGEWTEAPIRVEKAEHHLSTQ